MHYIILFDTHCESRTGITTHLYKKLSGGSERLHNLTNVTKLVRTEQGHKSRSFCL